MKNLFVFLGLVIAIGGLTPFEANAQSWALEGGNWNELDSVDDFASAPDSASLDVGDESSESLTVEAWIYPRSFPAAPSTTGENEMIIAAKSNAYRLSIQRDKDTFGNSFPGFRFQVQIDTVSSFAVVASFSSVTLNQWYHIAGVFDNFADKIKLYVNGQQKVSSTVSSNLTNSSETFIVGGPPPSSGDKYFNGRIDEIRVSDVARYSSDFSSPSGPFVPDANTRALWHFDESVGSTVFADSSGNGNTLTGLNGDHSLPVSLSSFAGTLTPKGIFLEWRTESEDNNLGFHIYRSTARDGDYVRVTPTLIKGHGTDSTPHDYTFLDETAEEGQTYWYLIEDVDFTGVAERSHPIQLIFRRHAVTLKVLPTQFALYQNYPNPFNPETWMPYDLAADADVVITIYNARGGRIRTLALGTQTAGAYRSKESAAYWDGWSETGEWVSSGLYFYQIRAGDFTAAKRMVILK